MNKLKNEYNITVYNRKIFDDNIDVQNMKKKCGKELDSRYYLWALGSLFTNYIMENNDFDSVTYIDADHYFHQDIKLLYDKFGDKDIGIFRHRF